MNVYRKKPIAVEARQVMEPELVTPAHGRVRAELGDWVLRDPNTGDTWPIKPDLFAATYEAVSEIQDREEWGSMTAHRSHGQVKWTRDHRCVCLTCGWMLRPWGSSARWASKSVNR